MINHIVVEPTGSLFRLHIAGTLKEKLGAGLRLKFEPPGTECNNGRPFGIAEGAESACHLFAPFDLVVIAFDVDEGWVDVAKRD